MKKVNAKFVNENVRNVLVSVSNQFLKQIVMFVNPMNKFVWFEIEVNHNFYDKFTDFSTAMAEFNLIEV